MQKMNSNRLLIWLSNNDQPEYVQNKYGNEEIVKSEREELIEMWKEKAGYSRNRLKEFKKGSKEASEEEEWIKKYKKQGEKGLINQKPCPENLKLRTPIEIEEEVIYLRKKYHFIVIICYSSLHLLNTLHRKQKIPSTCTVTGI